MKDIRTKYCKEIDDINNIIKKFKESRVYELSSVSQDGTLNTNTLKLEELFEDLLFKMQIEAEGKAETMVDARDKALAKMNLE